MGANANLNTPSPNYRLRRNAASQGRHPPLSKFGIGMDETGEGAMLFLHPDPKLDSAALPERL